MLYIHCELAKGVVHQVAWIPAKFARLGAFLSLNGDNGWQIVEMGGQEEGQYLNEHERDYLRAFPSLEA